MAREEDSPNVLPSVETVNAKLYPIARDLYMYTRDQPQGAIKRYLDWIHNLNIEENAITAIFGSM
jgi:ABC-type phosphate transport system substrate-binding protein